MLFFSHFKATGIILEDAGVRYRVVSLTDAQFPPHSPLSRLTEKQRRVLIVFAVKKQNFYNHINLIAKVSACLLGQ
jgi:hypothetical protein